MVTLIEPKWTDQQPTIEEHVQYLKTWNMNSTAYVLTHKWNSVVERHQDVLKMGTIVQLWSFRISVKIKTGDDKQHPRGLIMQSSIYFLNSEMRLHTDFPKDF
ncbi:hypothetical protein Ddye_025630 [Dipteronia dyeriana]|uniref:Uncharacterized protein n=1 Tax=Dipteronia dyeriana TaxID=168575 RepID=A0AAD9TKN0_9ROSI|nr:hypothetical protein Ddye_025630 [Dipteronia dyeriana]